MKQLTQIFIWLVLMLLASCEEYYYPDIEVVPTMMVVESHVTNDPKQNYVKLSRALDFYSSGQQKAIVGAKVDLIEVGGLISRGIENGTGYFTFMKTPVPGKKYILRITHQTDVFESDPVIMPPLPHIDSLYTNHKVEITYNTDAYGVPMKVETPGREICIDAPITPSLEYYRFKWRSVLQWIYSPPEATIPPPPVFGWKSFYDLGVFNIAGSKQFSVSDQAKNHSILFLGYDNKAYLDSSSQAFHGWILIIDQYGIQKESYDFHEELNKQFTAAGSLFDPVLTQVYGNIHCKTDTKQIVAGFFDLNSYRQYRYFLYLSNENSKVYQRRLNQYLDISGQGTTVGMPPDFWENIY